MMEDDTNETKDVLQQMQKQIPESKKSSWISKGAQIINGINTFPNKKLIWPKKTVQNGRQY